MSWNSSGRIASSKYICGHCNSDITSNIGYQGSIDRATSYIHICHHCDKPTFQHNDIQIPGAGVGDDVEGITDESVTSLYKEARNCLKENAFTASILCSRKLLMNIAVSKKAEEGKSFKYYIEYLSEKGYIPPDGKGWVNQIREIGNEATHEIVIKSKEEAQELIFFIEMLLKFIFEFPSKVRNKTPKITK